MSNIYEDWLASGIIRKAILGEAKKPKSRNSILRSAGVVSSASDEAPRDRAIAFEVVKKVLSVNETGGVFRVASTSDLNDMVKCLNSDDQDFSQFCKGEANVKIFDSIFFWVDIEVIRNKYLWTCPII